MNRARKRNHYVVDSATDIINFTLERGDAVYNMEDGIEYIHTSYFKPLGYTLNQLISFTREVEDKEIIEDEINEDKVVVDEVETIEEEV